MAKDVIGLVDLARHSTWAISEQPRNPFTIRGRRINLVHPKTHYTFFEEQWAEKEEVLSLTTEGETGRRISDLHVTSLLYALRQDFFLKVSPSGRDSVVGWYLNPEVVFIDCIPAFFESFESAYLSKGAFGLQGRDFDILGYLSNDVATYVQKNFRRGVDVPFMEVTVPTPPSP